MKTPPAILIKLVRYLFGKLNMEEVEGDFNEQYFHDYKNKGSVKANLNYTVNLFIMIPTFLRRSKTQNRSKMNNINFQFYFKYALRSIGKYKFYHAINMLSLTLAFSSFIIIYLFVVNHHQKDADLKHIDRIVRLSTIGDLKENTALHSAIGPILTSESPDILSFARLYNATVNVTVEGKTESFEEDLVRTVSERLALKLWNDHTDFIGKAFTMKTHRGESVYSVTGILEDLPINSSYSTNILSFLQLDEKKGSLNARVSTSFPTYFKISDEAKKDKILGSLTDILKKHTEKEIILDADYVFRTLDEIKQTPAISATFIKAIDGKALFIFQIVGLVVLLLGLANYVNITAALSLKRAQEIGIRRIMGASGGSVLLMQFMETIIVSTLCIGFSALFTYLSIQQVEEFIGISLFYNLRSQTVLIAIGGVILLVITLIASVYPARVLSGLKYQNLLKSTHGASRKGGWIKNALLVSQFSIATFLIVGTLTFLKQLNFVNEEHNKGELSNVLVLKGNINDPEILKARLAMVPGIRRTSFGSVVPGKDTAPRLGVFTRDWKGYFDVHIIDENFMDILKIDILKGSNLFQDERNKTSHILINQALAELAIDEEPLGKEYNIYGKDKKMIMGIVENFPLKSLKNQVGPSAYFQATSEKYFRESINRVLIEVDEGMMTEVVEKASLVWNEVLLEEPFEAEFMTDRIEQIYSEEIKMGQLFGALTGTAIFIACIGIFGLLTFMVQARMKEIGIRKVLGANLGAVARILTSKMWLTLLLSICISYPISYYFLKDWLATFVYQTDLSLDLYIMTMLLFVSIVIFTASGQIFRAAAVNPAEILRDE